MRYAARFQGRVHKSNCQTSYNFPFEMFLIIYFVSHILYIHIFPLPPLALQGLFLDITEGIIRAMHAMGDFCQHSSGEESNADFSN